MEIGEKITPSSNFLDKKEGLKSRILNHEFISKIMNARKDNKLHIEFTNNKSFANFKNNTIGDMPDSLAKSLDFTDAISFNITNPNYKFEIKYVLLKNDQLLLLQIPKDYTIPGYSFSELTNINDRKLWFRSYKLFDKKGKLSN